MPVITDRGLREIDIGSWSGLTRAEIEERFPDGVRRDGETREQHVARVLATVERIARAHAGARLLIVSHGGTMGPCGGRRATSRTTRSTTAA